MFCLLQTSARHTLKCDWSLYCLVCVWYADFFEIEDPIVVFNNIWLTCENFRTLAEAKYVPCCLENDSTLLHLQQWNLKLKKVTPDISDISQITFKDDTDLAFRWRNTTKTTTGTTPPPFLQIYTSTPHSDWISLGFVFIAMQLICEGALKKTPNPKNSTAPRHNKGFVKTCRFAFFEINQYFINCIFTVIFHSPAELCFCRDYRGRLV